MGQWWTLLHQTVISAKFEGTSAKVGTKWKKAPRGYGDVTVGSYQYSAWMPKQYLKRYVLKNFNFATSRWIYRVTQKSDYTQILAKHITNGCLPSYCFIRIGQKTLININHQSDKVISWNNAACGEHEKPACETKAKTMCTEFLQLY